MAESNAYKYVKINKDGYCKEVNRQSKIIDADQYDELISIPFYTEEYIEKYYNRKNGKWYEDPEFTIEWLP